MEWLRKNWWHVAIVTVAGYVFVVDSLLPARHQVEVVPEANDFASYYYAVKVANDGGDPYDVQSLSDEALEEGSRSGVHPYLYPPPFLLPMVWVELFELHDAFRVWFWVNQFLLLGALFLLWRWLRAPPWALAMIGASLFAICDNGALGQANMVILCAALLGLAFERGEWLGAATMGKLSPALLVVPWVLRKKWRTLAIFAVSCLALSVLALLVVDFEAQLRFYTDVLPSMSTGEYGGLEVPISYQENHSIPEIFHRLWQGPDDHHLSVTARSASSIVAFTGIAVLTALSHLYEESETATRFMIGAWVCWLVLIPVYAYEHHFVWLLIPYAVVAKAIADRSLPWWSTVVALVTFVPISRRLRSPEDIFGLLTFGQMRDLKTYLVLALGGLCVWAAHRAWRGLVRAPAEGDAARACTPQRATGV